AGRTPATMLAVAIGLLVVVAALGQAQGLASTLVRTYLGERLVLDFRARLVNQVQRLSLSYHDSRGTADSLYRIQQDGPAIQSLMVDGAVPVVSAAITFGTMVAVTTRLDWQLALVGLAISPPLFFLSRTFPPSFSTLSPRARPYLSRQRGASGRAPGRAARRPLAAPRGSRRAGDRRRDLSQRLVRLRSGAASA